MLCERFTFDALHHCGLKVFTLLFVQRVNTSMRSRDVFAGENCTGAGASLRFGVDAPQNSLRQFHSRTVNLYIG